MRRLSYLRVAALAALAITASAVSANAGTIRLCTGAADGNYADAGDTIARYLTGDTKVVVVKDTGGSWGNVARLVNKPAEDPEACDAAIMQPDAVSVLKQGFYDESGKLTGGNAAAAAKVAKGGELYREYLQVVCNKESGVTDLSQLNGTDKKLAIGADGSGGWLIWQNLVYQDNGYASVIDQPIGGTDASSAAANGDVTCALFPAALGNATVKEADELFGDQLVLAGANDGDFNDAEDTEGKRLYTFQKMDGNAYPHLVATYWSGKVETISWLAQTYFNIDRVSKADRTNFIRAIGKARKELVGKYGG